MSGLNIIIVQIRYRCRHVLQWQHDFAALGVDERAEQLFALLRKADPRLAVGKTAADIERPATSIAQSSLFTGAVPVSYTHLDVYKRQGAASGLLDAALNEMVVAAIRLDDVEIVLAPAGVNVGIACLEAGFQRFY